MLTGGLPVVRGGTEGDIWWRLPHRRAAGVWRVCCGSSDRRRDLGRGGRRRTAAGDGRSENACRAMQIAGPAEAGADARELARLVPAAAAEIAQRDEERRGGG